MEGINTTTNDSFTNSLREELMTDYRQRVTPLTAVTGCLALTGIVGNAIVLYVHFFKYKKCNFRLFVLSLCMLDLAACFTQIPMEMHHQFFYFDFRTGWLCKLKSYMNLSLSISNVYVLALISVDRYRKVRHPHGWQLKRTTVQKCVAIIVVFSVFFAFPVVVLWGPYSGTVVYKNQTITVTNCIKSGEFKHQFWAKAYILSMVPHILVLCAVLVSYGFVFWTISETSMNNKVALEKVNKRNSKPIVTKSSSNGFSTNYQDSGPSLDLLRKLSKEAKIAKDAKSIGPCDISTLQEVISTESETEAKKAQFGSVKRERRARGVNVRKLTSLTFFFTIIFVVTAILYLVMGYVVAGRDIDHEEINLSETIFFLFLYRLYYVNYTMHPILYGFFDPQFKMAVFNIPRDISNSMRRRSISADSG